MKRALAIAALLALGACAPEGFKACPAQLPGVWEAEDGSTLEFMAGGALKAHDFRLADQRRVVSVAGNWAAPASPRFPLVSGGYVWTVDVRLARAANFAGSGLRLQLDCLPNEATLTEGADTPAQRIFRKD